MVHPDVRLLTLEDGTVAHIQLARLHAEEISGGFLTSLGIPLLTRLYAAISRSPSAFTLICTVDGTIGGFLCASTDTAKVYRQVLRRAWLHLFPALLRRIFSWNTVHRCWETLRYPSRSSHADLPKAEILNFCVSGHLQRSGIGRRLFAAMEDEFRRRGISQIRIVTGKGQESAIRFYEKLGAEAVGIIEVHAQVESRLFRYSIRRLPACEQGKILP